jgi:8-hydroxy-5-deazaflavin:NADPH oxidoreductase
VPVRVVGGVRIGLIGTGRIGSTVARLAIVAGHDVVLANSRGPQTLAGLVSELGADHASAATAADAAVAGDLVVVTIPMKSYASVPAQPLVGKVVVDTNNYYPARDGHIAAMDDGSTTSSEMLQEHLRGSRVVKAFNTIQHEQLGSEGRPSGSAGRRALPIAGDDPQARRTVAALIETFGFDVIDAGVLAEGFRFQPGTAAYNVRQTADELRDALAQADRERR